MRVREKLRKRLLVQQARMNRAVRNELLQVFNLVEDRIEGCECRAVKLSILRKYHGKVALDLPESWEEGLISRTTKLAAEYPWGQSKERNDLEVPERGLKALGNVLASLRLRGCV
jgi:hypothetical protein